MFRHLPGQVEYFQHGRTLSHDAVKLQVPQKLFLELAHAPPLVVEQGCFIERPFQPHAVDRLRQEIVSPAPDCIDGGDRKSTRLNSSHSQISYAVFCLKKKKKTS